MSFVISNKQNLAPKHNRRVRYSPKIIKKRGITQKKIKVSFGHPLFDSAVGIYCFNSKNSVSLPIIPDGCITLIFIFDDKTCNAFINGVQDEIKKLSISKGKQYLLIKLSPGNGYSLIKQNLSEIANQSLNVNDRYEWAIAVREALLTKKDFEERVSSASKIIKTNILDDDNESLIKYCTDRIIDMGGNLQIESLSKETGYSSRYIVKQFEKYVGTSPKFFSQILKLQTTLNKMEENKDALLIDIALDCGFFDHAHMNRTYNKLIHCSSGKIRNSGFSDINMYHIDEYIKEEI